MRTTGFAAALLASVAAGSAHADLLDPQELSRRFEAIGQWLRVGPVRDRDVITAPGNIDPRMALVPPQGGRMPVIAPPGKLRQQ